MGIFSGKANGSSDFVEQAPLPIGPTKAKRIAEGTDQQEAFWSSLRDDNSHLLVEARAGCGKSSSCREGMWRVLDKNPGVSIRYTVFTKANAKEFQDDCPPGVDVATLHSFGFEVLRNHFQSMVDKNKTYLILDEDRKSANLPRYLRKSIAMLVSQAKNQALRHDCDDGDLLQLLEHYEIKPYGSPALVVRWAKDVLKRAAEWVEVVDFDDMLWLPLLHGLEFRPCDLLFIDEVQDWNRCQHLLIPQLCPTGRIVAVGDRYQAIFAFRGADSDSIPNLENYLSSTSRRLRQLPLNLTFRCPKSHIRLAQEYVSDIEAHPSNGEGVVEHGHTLDAALERASPGHKVLCWTNAPLIGAALRLITQRRPAFVYGRAVGDSLLDIVHDARDARTVADLEVHTSKWQGRELSRLSGREGVEDLVESVVDRAAGLHAVLACCDSPGDVPVVINQLFAEKSNAVQFSTVHRAKGLEAEHVWLLDAQQREPKQPWEKRQRRNLKYVAMTRSKETLTFVKGQPVTHL